MLLEQRGQPRKIKIGRVVAQVTRDLDTTFKVKRSKVNLQGAGAYCCGLPHGLFGLVSNSQETSIVVEVCTKFNLFAEVL